MLNLKLTQNHIMLENPFITKDKTDAGVLLPKDLIKKKDQEDLLKADKLKIVKVGPDCKVVKEGDQVMVMLERINPGTSLKLIDNIGYILMRENDVIAIYDRSEAKSDLLL